MRGRRLGNEGGGTWRLQQRLGDTAVRVETPTEAWRLGSEGGGTWRLQ